MGVEGVQGVDKKGKTMRTETTYNSYVIEKKNKQGHWRLCQETWAGVYGTSEVEALAQFNRRLKWEREEAARGRRWAKRSGRKVRKAVARNYRLVKVKTVQTIEIVDRKQLKQTRRVF